MKYYGLVMLSVTELVATIVALLFLGKFLDHRFDSGSQYMTIGAVAGLIIGVVRMTFRLKGLMDNGSDT
jgi:F0F1-type ATP synthase assembly protein I